MNLFKALEMKEAELVAKVEKAQAKLDAFRARLPQERIRLQCLAEKKAHNEKLLAEYDELFK